MQALFTDFLTQAKNEIESASDKFLQEQINNTEGNPFAQAALRDLHMQNEGGKRVRGAFIKLGEVIAGGEKNESRSYLPIAVAYELFQTAILIHDDITDNSSTRRGKPTIHTTEDNAHYGMSRALFVGDYGLFLANSILAGLPEKLVAPIFKLFAHIQLKTEEGQVIDVSLPHNPVDIIAAYDKYLKLVYKIYECKTAWYTLAGPIMLGAICGGGNEKLQMLLRSIALPLGIAFQIKDDMLLFESEEAQGKPALSDVFEKKQTLLYGYAYKYADNAQRLQLNGIYGNAAASNDDLNIVREIFTATGAREYCESEVLRLSQESLDLIEQLDEKHKPLMRGAVQFLIERKF